MRRKVLFRWNRTPVREIGKYSQTAHAGDFSNQLYESCIGWWLRGTSVSLFHISILKWKEVIWAIIYIKNLWKYWDCNYLTVTQMLMTLLMILHFTGFSYATNMPHRCVKKVWVRQIKKGQTISCLSLESLGFPLIGVSFLGGVPRQELRWDFLPGAFFLLLGSPADIANVGVHVVIDSDVADTEHGEAFLNVQLGVEFVSAQSGQKLLAGSSPSAVSVGARQPLV